MTVSATVVDLLEEAGVRRCYTVPGESFLEILDAVEQHARLSLISARHESGASFMAEADAKLTGVPAVAMATRGVGASNLAIGVHTARQDSTPMVVLLGQVETTFLGREAFQEVDLPDFYGQITKWSATVHRADRLPEFVAKALHIATTGRPGPVMLALPADILGEDVGSPKRRFSAASRARPAPTSQDVQELARRIVGAKRPVMILGGGTRDAREELISFADAFGVGVYASFRRQDHFPNDHPNYLGHLTLGTPPATLNALEEADLVFVVGCRLSEVTTQSYTLPRPAQAVIQVDIDPDVVGAVVPVELGVVAGARETLAAMVSLAPSSRPERDWDEAHGAYLESSAIPESRAENGVDPARVVAVMREVLPTDTILTNDAGNFSAFLHRYWRYTHPKTQLAPTSGAMGYGLPAAVAAKTAAPDRRVVAVAGDGGFMMTGQELETAVRYGVNILVVVFKNGMHGTIAMHQMRSVGRTAGTEIGQIDLATYASSLGAQGWSVSDEDDLDEVLRESLEAEGPTLVEVVTDPDLITPTARLSELGKATTG
jgi:acetolactate synthase I/II/III large subunit